MPLVQILLAKRWPWRPVLLLELGMDIFIILIRKNGWIRSTWAPGRGVFSIRSICLMKNSCAIRMTNLIIACALRVEKFCFAQKLYQNTLCVILLSRFGVNIFSMVIGKSVFFKNILGK